MERLKKAFPMLPICLCADSLYACEPFFKKCDEKHWKYLIRYKEGSITSIYEEYVVLKKREHHIQWENKGEEWYDFVCDIGYQERKIHVIEYGKKETYPMRFLTNLSVRKQNVKTLIEYGRKRWYIENQGFNTQKRQGYYLEHMYSKTYQGIKNHYYLIQIGHMISQVLEAWEVLWKEVRLSREQKHRRMLESWKTENLYEYEESLKERRQIRLQEG